jgi:hypothetical protein
MAPAVVRTRLPDRLTEQEIDYITQRIRMRRTGMPEEGPTTYYNLSFSAIFVPQNRDNSSELFSDFLAKSLEIPRNRLTSGKNPRIMNSIPRRALG